MKSKNSNARNTVRQPVLCAIRSTVDLRKSEQHTGFSRTNQSRDAGCYKTFAQFWLRGYILRALYEQFMKEVIRVPDLRRSLVLFLLGVFLTSISLAVEAPKLVQQDGRWALLVEGHPYLILGGQVHNSSAWPAELPQVWKSLEALHANTIEAPLYWEQVEPQPGRFDWSNVDQLVKGAREHNLHVVLLWFGTWKNGNMHYVPEWVKTDTQRFPRVIRADGEPIDVLSASSRSNLEADKAAFTALMRHLKAFDGDQHTVLLVQVENESGIIGSPRDFSPDSNKEFAGPVPADMLAAAHKQSGSWREVFDGDADELFQLYHQAHYLNEIAAAGKGEFDIPLYMNVWLSYPPAELPERQLLIPG